METRTNAQELRPLIEEYESVFDALGSQLIFYANEQENLQKEIAILINENASLRKTVDELLKPHQENSKENISENEVVDNLKRQLSLTLKEKDTVVELWQNALKNIDHLEEELRLYEGRTYGYLHKNDVIKIKQKYENQISKVQAQLLEANTKLVRLQQEYVPIKDLENNKFINYSLKEQARTDEMIKGLEKEVPMLQEKLKEIMLLRDKLQSRLNKKDALIQELNAKELEAKRKVTEAVHIVEEAFLERDIALLREAKARDEVIQISKTLSDIMQETAEKIKVEIESIKEACDSKIKDIEKANKQLKEELNIKTVELERCKKDFKSLEDELERVRKGNLYIDDSNTSKLLILEKNLESTFQKLLISERKNLQLNSEKECIKADLEQMANFYQNDIKTREIEMQVLKHELKSIKGQLKHGQSSIIAAAGKLDKANSRMRLACSELEEKLKVKDSIHEGALKRTLSEIEKRNKKDQCKLLSLLEKQIDLNKKWKKEFFESIDNFQLCYTEIVDKDRALEHKIKEMETQKINYQRKLNSIFANLENKIERSLS